MKLAVIGLLLMGTAAWGKTLKVDLDFQSQWKNDGWRGDYYRSPGQPKLPVKWVSVVLPYRERLEEIEFIPSEKTMPAVEHPVSYVPYPRPACSNDLPLGKELFFEPNEAHPKSMMGDFRIVEKHGYTIVSVPLFPLRLYPHEGTAYLLAHGELKIKTAKTKDEHPLFRGTPEDRDAVLPLAPERSEIASYPIKRSRAPQYLVIGPQFLMEGTTGIPALLKQKESEGMVTQVLSTETITSTYQGRDLQEKIRNAIIDQYKTQNTEYVLLVGDGKTYTPTRKMWVGLRGTLLPSDFYFACLDGTFDNNKNNYFGETVDGIGGKDVDLACEVAVGRLPATTREEVERFVLKTRSWRNVTAQDPRVWNMLNFGEKMDSYTVGSATVDKLLTGAKVSSLTMKGYPAQTTPTKLYETLSSVYSAKNVSDSINKGAYYTVNHLGHGNQDYCLRNKLAELDNWMNPLPFFLITEACFCGDISTTNWASKLITDSPAGAVSVVANSHYGWYEPGGWDGPSLNSHLAFYDTIFQEGQKVSGKAHFRAKERIIPDAQASLYLRWTMFDANLLGDPALKFAF